MGCATDAVRIKGGTVSGEIAAGRVVGATGPVGCVTDAVRVKGGIVSGGVAAGYVVGAMGPVGCTTGAVRAKGGTVFGETAVGVTEPVGGVMGTGHRPVCARWPSTAAIAAAVTASTIWFKEGGGQRQRHLPYWS